MFETCLAFQSDRRPESPKVSEVVAGDPEKSFTHSEPLKPRKKTNQGPGHDPDGHASPPQRPQPPPAQVGGWVCTTDHASPVILYRISAQSSWKQ